MRKIPKLEYEETLRQIAEADGYSFVRWADGYKGRRSLAEFECPDHGRWVTAAGAFTGNGGQKGSRCARCKGVKKFETTERVVQIQNLLTRDGYTFVSFTDGIVAANCHTHGGYSTSFASFYYRNARCTKCSGKYKFSECERVAQINDKCVKLDLIFDGWVTSYTNAHSKMKITCPTHGQWVTTVNGFINNDTSCQGCAGLSRILPDDREQQIIDLLHDTTFEFVRWDGGYTNSKSKAVIKCPTHGEWSVSAQALIQHGHRCPSCAIPGYRPALPGTLYSLLSECGTMIKIGISNKPLVRFSALRRATPFKFSVHRQLHCEDGSHPPMLERMFHGEFPSAGLICFDGATEWRVWYPEVNTWFDLLGG